MKIEKISTGYLNVERLTLDNGVKRERVNHPDVVAAIVFKPETKTFLFVEQYRPGCDKRVVEIVAGKVDPGEDLRTALEREILEELGWKVHTAEIIVDEYYPTIGYSTEKITIFICDVIEKVNDGGGIGNEDIKIIEMTMDELMNYDFIDGKSKLAISMFVGSMLQNELNNRS